MLTILYPELVRGIYELLYIHVIFTRFIFMLTSNFINSKYSINMTSDTNLELGSQKQFVNCYCGFSIFIKLN